MASNSSTIADESGAFPDWVELYNPTESEISLSGYYLTDDLANQTKWAFPDTVIQPKDFLLIWVDDDEEDGPMHASFKLSKSGEDLGLYHKTEMKSLLLTHLHMANSKPTFRMEEKKTALVALYFLMLQHRALQTTERLQLMKSRLKIYKDLFFIRITLTHLIPALSSLLR